MPYKQPPPDWDDPVDIAMYAGTKMDYITPVAEATGINRWFIAFCGLLVMGAIVWIAGGS